MGTITLDNVRATSDITVKVRLKDGGLAIDWSGLTDIRAWLYSDAQKAIAGRFDVSVDQEDTTTLLCDYSARKPQYLGVNRVIVQAKYMGRIKTYDKPCLNLVPRTADVSGTTVVLEDPVVEVSIEVTDVSSSILDTVILAALDAAERANDAAEAAEHMVDIHTGPQGPAGKSPYIDETTGNWFIYDDETGEYVDSGNQAKGDTGNGIASWSVVESDQDGGSNVVTVTFTDGTSETFTYKNGHTGATPQISIGTVTTGEPGDPAAASMTGTAAAPVLNLTIPKGQKGDQGNTGSSVDYPFELVNNETTDDATKAHTAQGAKRLKDEISQLEAELTAFPVDISGLSQYNVIVNGSGKWTAGAGKSVLLPIVPGETYKAVNNSGDEAYIAVLSQSTPGTSGTSAQFATGYTGRVVIQNGDFYTFVAPNDAATLSIRLTDSSNNNITPKIYYGTLEDIVDSIDKLSEDIVDSPIDISGLSSFNGIINASNKWYIANGVGKSVLLPITPGKKYKAVNKSGDSAYIAVTAESSPGANNTAVVFATGFPGRIEMQDGDVYSFTAPSDAVTLYIRLTDSGNNDITPDIYSDDINDTIAPLRESVQSVESYQNNTKINYTPGVWFPPSPATADGIPVKKDGYVITDYIRVRKGCKFDWIYGATPASSMRMSVYDTSKNFVDFYTNSYSDHRAISNFMNTGADDEYLVRASFRLSDISDSFIVVDGACVWSYEPIPIQDLVEFSGSIDLSAYERSGCYENSLWQSYGNCYILPVSAGDVFYLKTSNGQKYYYAFMSALPVVGSAPSLVGSENGSNADVWARVVVPVGATYLYINKKYSSSTDHTPFVRGKGGMDADALVSGTFNSSFNELDTTELRERFCGKIQGKDNIETFLFFTDPHLTPNSRYETMTELVRDKYISTLQKCYNSLPMDSCICGGDWLNFNHPDAEACGYLGYCDAYMRKLFKHYLPVFGNHDNNPYTPDSSSSNWLNALYYEDIKNLMFRENGNTYYSEDGINTKFYVLNSGVSFIKGMTDATYSRLVSNRWTQVDWLANKLLADDAENSIIVMHIYANAENETEWFATGTGYWANGIHALGANCKSLAVAYNNRESITLNGITYDFSACTGKVMFILCGHTHWDYIDTTGEIPIVCCTDLEGGYESGDSLVYALVPTFDCCMADLDGNAFYMTRVGVGVDRIVNYVPVGVSTGNAETLSTKLTGTVSWTSRDGDIATVASGVVTGVASGCVGIIATDENGAQEYWIVKVS